MIATPPAAPQRILAVKLSSFGDIVHVTGCLRAIREQHPAAEITVAVDARFARLVHALPWVDRVIEARPTESFIAAWRDARRTLRAAGPPRFDLAIDFQGRRRSAAWVYASGARVKAGRGGVRPGWSIVHRPDLAQHAVMMCADVARAAGIVVADPSPVLRVPADADASVSCMLAARGMPDRGFLAVNPFSAWRSKEWPLERYVAALRDVCACLRVPAVVVGGVDERERGAELARRVARPDVVSLAGALGLDEALAVYARAALMLTGDSGPMHAAAALGTPVVALFGPTLPELTGPWGEGHVVVQARRPSRHDGYRDDATCSYIGTIDVPTVVGAVLGAWQRGRRVAATTPTRIDHPARTVASPLGVTSRVFDAPSRRKRLLHVLRAAGLYHHRAARSVWLHGDTPRDFAVAHLLIRELRAAAPAHRIVFTSASPATCAWLTRRYPNDFTLPAPITAMLVARFVRQLRPEVLVTAGAPIAPRWLGRAARRISTMSGDGAAARDVVAHLMDVSALDSATRGGRVPSRSEAFARTTAGRALVACHPGRRLDGVEALAAHVRRPSTILCLGNGPSSEDPRVAATAHDVLFRVNWRWRDRDAAGAPAVVFVGDHRSVWRVRGCVFAFKDAAFEREVRFGSLARGRWRRWPSFVVADALPWTRDDAWRARPTNGALMIATAAALRPARLVIAGIDLFADPRGKYPGDPEAENAYAPVHDRDVDVAVIRRALAAYDGEVTIIGDALATALGADSPATSVRDEPSGVSTWRDDRSASRALASAHR